MALVWRRDSAPAGHRPIGGSVSNTAYRTPRLVRMRLRELNQLNGDCTLLSECVTGDFMRSRTWLVVTALIFVTALVLSLNRSQASRLEGTFQKSPTYDSAVP